MSPYDMVVDRRNGLYHVHFNESMVNVITLSSSAVHACGNFFLHCNFSRGFSHLEFVIPFNSSSILLLSRVWIRHVK